MDFLPYAKHSIHDADLDAVANALRGEWITRGPIVQNFEERLAEYCNAPYAVAFNSGTAALMATYFAARLSPFDRVISTPNTFIATVGAPIQMGLRVNFVDIDRSTGSMDVSQLNTHLDFRSTRGRPFIVPMHFAGIAIDMAELNRQISDSETIVIEDAAHALGSKYPTGQKVGSCTFSHMTMFSFHPAKILTTGEGGMVTTKDPELYHRLKLFRDNGIEREPPGLTCSPVPGYYEVHAISGNFNVTSFQAALGLSQLKRLEEFITKRRMLVEHYRKHFQHIPHCHLLTDRQDSYTAFHLFVVQIDFKAYQTTRENVMQSLKEKGIGSQIHYIPLYHHPVLKRNVWDEKKYYPQTEAYYSQALSLPLYFDLNTADVDRICSEIFSILKINQ